MSDRDIYLGRGKFIFEDTMAFSLNLTRLKNEAMDHVFEFSGSKFIKLKVRPLKGGADQNGKTHTVQVDTFKPKQQSDQQTQQQTEAPVNKQDEPEDEIPF